MKNAKKIISLVLMLLIVLTSSVVLTSASNETIYVDNFNPMLRYWHYGGYPDKVTYTTGGYAILESEHFAQQHQVCYYGQPLTEQWSKMFAESLVEGDGILGFDVYVKDCYGTNTLEATGGLGYQQNSPAVNVIIKCSYTDSKGREIEEDVLNFESSVGEIGIEAEKHFIFGLNDDYTAYDNFKITFVKIAVMNYANLANENGEQGCGKFYVRFSPFYIEGQAAPEIGEEIPESRFNPDDYAWESTDKVTTIDQGNLTPDGPLFGGVDMKRNDEYLPYLADGVTVAKLIPNNPDLIPAEPTTQPTEAPTTQPTTQPTTNPTFAPTTKPACAHGITTEKVSKVATYFENGENTIICALCDEVISTKAVAKKVLSKPSITVKGQKKAVKITWKKVTGATGYVVEMKQGKKYKVVKTITKGKTVSYTQKKLKKGTKYTFRVKALVNKGSKKVYSKYSAVKSVKAK